MFLGVCFESVGELVLRILTVEAFSLLRWWLCAVLYSCLLSFCYSAGGCVIFLIPSGVKNCNVFLLKVTRENIAAGSRILGYCLD